MSITNYAQGVSSFGVPQMGPNPFLINPAGAVLFVNSQTGLDNRGRVTFPGSSASSVTGGSTQGPQGDPTKPLATLAYALTFTKSGRGDIIVVMQGHAETLTAVVTLATNNVTIYGCGQEAGRPTFTLGIATALTITGNNNVIANCAFDASAQSNLSSDILVSGIGNVFYSCKLVTHTGTGIGLSLATGWGTTRIDTCAVVNSSATAVATGIGVAAGDGLRITNTTVRGVFSTAPITGTGAVINWHVDYNTIRQLSASVIPVVSLGATTDTGAFEFNSLYSTAATTAAGFIAGTGAAAVGVLWAQNYGFNNKAGGPFGAILIPATSTLT